jgi:hypothetical protein
MAGVRAVQIPGGSKSSGRPSMGLKIENFTDDEFEKKIAGVAGRVGGP